MFYGLLNNLQDQSFIGLKFKYKMSFVFKKNAYISWVRIKYTVKEKQEVVGRVSNGLRLNSFKRHWNRLIEPYVVSFQVFVFFGVLAYSFQNMRYIIVSFMYHCVFFLFSSLCHFSIYCVFFLQHCVIFFWHCVIFYGSLCHIS